MKEFIDLVKNLWANKRTRALAILLVYFVFFIFVFMFIGNSNKTPIINMPKQLKNMKISKIEFIGNDNFIFENNTIIYNDSIYIVNEMPIELSKYNLSIYTINNIDKLIDSAVLETTNHVEKSNTYLISAKEFESIIFNNIIESDLNIRIKTDKEFNYVHLDFKDYYGYEVRIDLRS